MIVLTTEEAQLLKDLDKPIDEVHIRLLRKNLDFLSLEQQLYTLHQTYPKLYCYDIQNYSPFPLEELKIYPPRRSLTYFYYDLQTIKSDFSLKYAGIMRTNNPNEDNLIQFRSFFSFFLGNWHDLELSAFKTSLHREETQLWFTYEGVSLALTWFLTVKSPVLSELTLQLSKQGF